MKEKTTLKYEIKTAEGTGAFLTGFYKSSVTVLEIYSADVTVFVGTESASVKPGSFVYVPAGLAFRVFSDDTAAVRSITFPEKASTEYMEKIDSDLYYMFSVQLRGKVAVFEPSHPIYEQIAFAVTEILDEYSGKDICWGLHVRANIYMLFSAILRHYFSAKNELDRTVYHNVLRLRPALDYISEHCGEKIYIETLSEMLSVSPDYFTKMFRDSIGKTPIDYINAARVNRSLELLAATDAPLSEIAEMSGFSNANYFHKIFKTYMQTSPLAYRKSSKR